MDFKLGAKTIEFVPMTWKTQKRVFSLVLKAVAAKVEAQSLVSKLIGAIVSGGEKVPLSAIVETVEGIPDLLDQVLIAGLGVTQEDLDSANGAEVLEALRIFIDENDLADQMAKAKNAFTLLATNPA